MRVKMLICRRAGCVWDAKSGDVVDVFPLIIPIRLTVQGRDPLFGRIYEPRKMPREKTSVLFSDVHIFLPVECFQNEATITPIS